MRVDELPSGASCTGCGKDIEVNLAWSAAYSLSLLFMALLSFQQSQYYPGLAFTIVLAIYGTFYLQLSSRYMPLKHYPKGDV